MIFCPCSLVSSPRPTASVTLARVAANLWVMASISASYSCVNSFGPRGTTSGALYPSWRAVSPCAESGMTIGAFALPSPDLLCADKVIGIITINTARITIDFGFMTPPTLDKARSVPSLRSRKSLIFQCEASSKSKLSMLKLLKLSKVAKQFE